MHLVAPHPLGPVQGDIRLTQQMFRAAGTRHYGGRAEAHGDHVAN